MSKPRGATRKRKGDYPCPYRNQVPKVPPGNVLQPKGGVWMKVPTREEMEAMWKAFATPEGRAKAAGMTQGSHEHMGLGGARTFVLTASDFGAATGRNTTELRNLLLYKVWPELRDCFNSSFAEGMMQRGRDMEPFALKRYVDWRQDGGSPGHAHTSNQFGVWNAGMLVHPQHGWLAATPDFFVAEPRSSWRTGTAPGANPSHLGDPVVVRVAVPPLAASTAPAVDWLAYSEQVEEEEQEQEHAAAAHTPAVDWLQYAEAPAEPELAPGTFRYGPLALDGPPSEDAHIVVGGGEIKNPAVMAFYSDKPAHAKYGVPEKYYDQIQGAMNIGGYPWWDVVVNLPDSFQVTRFPRNETYWQEVLFPLLNKFFFEYFLPTLELRRIGALQPGEVVPTGKPTAFPAPLAEEWPQDEEDPSRPKE